MLRSNDLSISFNYTAVPGIMDAVIAGYAGGGQAGCTGGIDLLGKDTLAAISEGGPDYYSLTGSGLITSMESWAITELSFPYAVAVIV